MRRECTGQRALLVNESRARKGPKQTNQNQTNQQPPTNQPNEARQLRVQYRLVSGISSCVAVSGSAAELPPALREKVKKSER